MGLVYWCPLLDLHVESRWFERAKRIVQNCVKTNIKNN